MEQNRPEGDASVRKRISLADVAAEAGVSISTVSKVANGSVEVAASTRSRVERILRQRGYVGTRKRGVTRVPIAVLARDMQTPFTLDVIRGATVAAERLGVDLSVAIYSGEGGGTGWIDDLHSAGRKGILALTSVLDDRERARLAERNIEVVVVDAFHDPDAATYSIGATNWAGGLEAAEYLLGLGHRRIVMLGGESPVMANRARVSGYLAAVNGWEGPHDAPRVISGEFTYESGLEETTKILEGEGRPTAILAASDFQALGALEAARRLELRVPEDLSVVGFDDLIVAGMASPRLTTVNQPLEKMGALAIETIVALLGGSTTTPHHTELATHLVVRESTSRPSFDENMSKLM